MEPVRAVGIASGDTIVEAADESVYYIMRINPASSGDLWFAVMKFTNGHAQGPMEIGPYDPDDGGFFRVNTETIPYSG